MNTTVLIPFLRGGNQEWLKEAIGSLPVGTPYMVLENDGELAEALNAGLKAATTEFVFRLDADDTLDGLSLPILEDLCWNVDVCYPTLRYVTPDLTPFETRKAAPFCPNRLLTQNYISGCALFRPEKALQVGGYRDMPILEDWDLWVRMMRAGCSFKAVPEAILNYRRHQLSRNMTTEDVAAVQDRMRQEIVGTEPDLKATFYYQASYATTYWRCLLPARFLPGQAVDHAGFVMTDDDLAFPEHRGAAVWQFPGDGARAIQMAEMQRDGIRVLVESDDSYFDTSPLGNPGWVKNLRATKKELADGNKRSGKHSLEAHTRIVPWVDGVTVTTEHLAKRYRRYNPNVYVCPNQIDPADWPAPEPELVLPHTTWRRDDGVLRVGWFASPSHGRDAALVYRALEWASKQKDVEVVTMGLDPAWTFRRTHIPWSNDAGVYKRFLTWLDVGLAPVVETPWAVCRSDLKALEYGAARVAPVVSDAIPYRGYTGPCLRAPDAKGFFNHVKCLVGNRDEVRQLGLAAREHVMAERTVAGNIHRWLEAIEKPAQAKAA